MSVIAEIKEKEKLTVKILEREKINVTLGNTIVSSAGKVIEIGDGLKLEDNILSVDTVNKVEEDNTKPITSGAVYTEIGNIETLLSLL